MMLLDVARNVKSNLPLVDFHFTAAEYTLIRQHYLSRDYKYTCVAQTFCDKHKQVLTTEVGCSLHITSNMHRNIEQKSKVTNHNVDATQAMVVFLHVSVGAENEVYSFHHIIILVRFLKIVLN